MFPCHHPHGLNHLFHRKFPGRENTRLAINHCLEKSTLGYTNYWNSARHRFDSHHPKVLIFWNKYGGDGSCDNFWKIFVVFKNSTLNISTSLGDGKHFFFLWIVCAVKHQKFLLSHFPKCFHCENYSLKRRNFRVRNIIFYFVSTTKSPGTVKAFWKMKTIFFIRRRKSFGIYWRVEDFTLITDIFFEVTL